MELLATMQPPSGFGEMFRLSPSPEARVRRAEQQVDNRAWTPICRAL